MEILFFLIIGLVLWLTNHLVFKYAGKNKKRRVLSGLAVMLFAPVIYYLTFGSVAGDCQQAMVTRKGGRRTFIPGREAADPLTW